MFIINRHNSNPGLIRHQIIGANNRYLVNTQQLNLWRFLLKLNIKAHL